MPRGRRKKKQDSVLFKTAEMIGWALGGIEREIGQTRERLAALLKEAERMRARTVAGRGRGAQAGAAEKAAAPAATARKRKRKISPEGRKRIAENLKKRWAAAKKAGRTRL